jgi:ABC-type branched-subunit amino acid transport system substrate-binding protein
MRGRGVAICAAVALLATACSNSSGSKKPASSTTAAASGTPIGGGVPVNEPGVTPTEIRVSGVTATTNPIGGLYGTAFDGVQAFFDMVNSRGGIYGRKLVIVKRRDDNLANNLREVQALIDQDNAFAVLPIATPLFTGASLLAKTNIPTFGWNIQSDWQGPLNFFPQVGALCIGGDCPGVPLADLVRRLGKQRVGVLGYNVQQSADCVDLVKATFDKYPTAKVAYASKSLSFGVTDLSSDVKKLADANVDFVTTCMDQNGVLTLAREMRQQGLNALQYLPNGYDQEFMAKNAGFFEGSLVQVMVAPIETRPLFPALRDYITWMDKAGSKKTENAEVGWVNAAMFLRGLELAGPSFSRQKVIDELNKLTDYDAGGMIPPVNWTRQHTDKHYAQGCQAYLKVHNGTLTPTFGQPGKPFLCYANTEAPTVDGGRPFVRQ